MSQLSTAMMGIPQKCWLILSMTFWRLAKNVLLFLRVRWFVSFLVYFDLLEGQRVFGGLFVQACRYSKKLSRFREPGKQCEITGIKVNVQWNHPQIAFFQPCFERICL
jgi:hypothetical protein